LKNATEISSNAKFNETTTSVTTNLNNIFLGLSTNDPRYYTVIYLLEEIVLLKNVITDVSPILHKVMSDGNILYDQGDFHTAIRVLNIGLRIATKHGKSDLTTWYDKLGLISESAGDKEIAIKNFFGSSFYEQAADFFKLSKNSDAMRRALLKFQEARSRIQLELFTSELSNEEKISIEAYTRRILDKNNPILIFHIWTLRPNISEISEIRKHTDPEPNDPFWDIGLDAIDKFGNTVERYQTRDQQKEQRFWEAFGYELNFASKLSYKLTIEALEEGRINSEILITFLEITWLNQPIVRYYQNVEHAIIPLELLNPGIRTFFQAFSRYVKGEEVTAADFMMSIDSLILKIEMLFRFICDKLNIPTIVQKQSKNKFLVPRFKTLSNLFDNLTSINFWNERDEAILRFLFIEPEHANIRNEIAHGLTDLNEYSPELGLRIIGALVLISSYEVE
jgi:hypothetical protein